MNIFIIAHFVTAALVVLKLTDISDLSWWIVFSPSLIGLVVAFVIGFGVAIYREIKQ